MDLMVLTYGNHVTLAARCLNSIYPYVKRGGSTIRIGLNEVSSATEELVLIFSQGVPGPVFLYQEVQNKNVYKYPLMRRMFYDSESPVTSEYVMWFDDDSFVKNERLWSDVASVLGQEQPVLLGSTYVVPPFSELQCEAIRDQPWYAGQPVGGNKKPRFCTGGWWVARHAELARWDYPFLAIQHNGGDVLLGELCRQQGYKVVHYNRNVAINANREGRESAAARRGVTTERPWSNYREDCYRGPDYAHQAFLTKVRVYQDGRLAREYTLLQDLPGRLEKVPWNTM